MTQYYAVPICYSEDFSGSHVTVGKRYPATFIGENRGDRWFRIHNDRGALVVVHSTFPRWEIHEEVSPDKSYTPESASDYSIHDLQYCQGTNAVCGTVFNSKGLNFGPAVWDRTGTCLQAPFNWKSPKECLNLVEERKAIRAERWLNIYPDGRVVMWSTRAQADQMGLNKRFACVKLEVKAMEGEGLS